MGVQLETLWAYHEDGRDPGFADETATENRRDASRSKWHCKVFFVLQKNRRSTTDSRRNARINSPKPRKLETSMSFASIDERNLNEPRKHRPLVSRGRPKQGMSVISVVLRRAWRNLPSGDDRHGLGQDPGSQGKGRENGKATGTRNIHHALCICGLETKPETQSKKHKNTNHRAAAMR